jgi:hypothetical protein
MDMSLVVLTAMALLSCGVAARLFETVSVVTIRQGKRKQNPSPLLVRR